MPRLSELIKALADTPDDLSTLPEIIAQAEELENENAGYVDRVTNLQESNRKLLGMIPATTTDPTEIESEGEVELTMEDASKALEEIIMGGQ